MNRPKNPRLVDFDDLGLMGEQPIPAAFSSITLRDLFAAASIAGQRANGTGGGPAEQVARTAYSDANEALMERGRWKA